MRRISPKLARHFLRSFAAASAMALVACGGGSDSPSPSPAPTPAPTPAPSPLPAANVTLDFSLQGLKDGQTVTVSFSAASGSGTNTSTRNVVTTYNRNVPFGALALSYAVGTTYAYTIDKQPIEQICAIDKSTGTLATDTQVLITCK